MKILITESQLRHVAEMSIKAFHGTPHKFDRFTTDKIGSGESTQWFGWGLYFTDDESIANWYSKSVRELKNKEHVEKKVKLYYKDELVYDNVPNGLDGHSFWKVMKDFKELNGLPLDIIHMGGSYERFMNYKRSELKGEVPNYSWFDKDRFINEYNSNFESTRRQYGWSPNAYKDEELGLWVVPRYEPTDKYILRQVKDWNKKFSENNTPEEYIKRFYSNKINRGWRIIVVGNDISFKNEMVDFNHLTDEKMVEYRDIQMRILESFKPEDFRLQYDDPLYTKSNIYNVTLHKGKTPDEYDYLDWYGKLTPRQKEKILSKLKEKGYASRKFVKVAAEDDDNLEAVKPRFFDNVRDAKNYIDKRNLKAMLMGNSYEGYIGGLKIEKDGFNLKTDLDGTVKDFYTKLCGLVGSDRLASLILLSAGIDGIKYPTNTISGGESTGFNYVIFDEKSIEIDKVDEKD
jgi:hypothetical protein